MDFNKEYFRKNKNIIFILFFVIILVLAICLINTASYKLLQKDMEKTGKENIKGLVINEIMTSNSGSVSDEFGNTYDWIEIYNGNDYDINLKNYGLSDKESTIKWVFPDVTINSNSYLVIYLSGKNETGLYANFKLSSSGGETLELKDTNGKTIDSVKTQSITKNSVMARNLEGNWVIYEYATPGYSNTIEGHNLYIESIKDFTSPIKINEVLPRNEGNFQINNKYYGYVEIINEGEEAINIKDYSISNTLDIPFKYNLPDIILEPNETKVVFMGDENNDDYLFSNFKLDSNSGVVVLTSSNGKIIDEVEYTDLTNGLALVKNEDDFNITSQISPGFPNTLDGGKEFSNKFLNNKNGIIINEVMNSNSSYLAQNGGKYYDWIELKNNSTININLGEYYLTTNENSKQMYKLPDVTLKSGEFYIIIASGDENLSNSTYKHSNFKLSKIESLYLTKDNNIVDSIFIADVPTGYSMGRNDSSGFYYFSSPTPGVQNKNGVREVSKTPIFDIKSGIYNDVDNLILTINSKGTVYYTLDGSIPTTSSKKYTGPLSLTKTTVVKAISYEEGKIKSEMEVGSYIINENHTLPVMSVSLNPKDFNIVSSNAWNTNLEVEAYAELYEEDNSFLIPCGFKLFGGSTRGLNKKSFALKFRKKYGEEELHYQVFDNRDFSTFNTLVLRSGSQDSERAFFRDILATSLVDGMINVDVQSYKSVILYINGNYWGIYNIREKVDEEFISNHYNVSSDNTNIINILNGTDVGSGYEYNALVNYISTHDLSVTKNYEYVKSKLDIESFIDFWVAETYVTNNDILNTRFFSNPYVDDGKFNMIFYDLDYGMYNFSHNYFEFTVNPNGMSSFNVSTLFMRKLIQNEEFKKLYLERISYQLKNVWNKERVLAKIDELYNYFLPEMPRNQERWNLTMDTWNERVEYLKTYVTKRQGYMVSQAKSFFKLNDEEYRKYFGDL